MSALPIRISQAILPWKYHYLISFRRINYVYSVYDLKIKFMFETILKFTGCIGTKAMNMHFSSWLKLLHVTIFCIRSWNQLNCIYAWPCCHNTKWNRLSFSCAKSSISVVPVILPVWVWQGDFQDVVFDRWHQGVALLWCHIDCVFSLILTHIPKYWDILMVIWWYCCKTLSKHMDWIGIFLPCVCVSPIGVIIW